MPRENLKKARKEAGLTQQQMADELHITIRHYKALESGERLGRIQVWDAIVDILKGNQRVLRSTE